MHAKYVLTLLTGLTVASAIAIPEPAAAVARATKGKATPNADKSACQALADGIQKNIDIQHTEQKNVETIKTIVSANPIDQAKFADAKKTFLATIQSGIDARVNNQKIAPAGNPATDGLKTVAKAQAEELSLAQSLKGTSADLATIKKLEGDFSGGIDQNTKNKAAALTGCN